jgi:flagellar hook-associated protein 1 FlgK
VVDRFLEESLLTMNRDLGSAEAERQAMVSIQEVFPTSGGIDVVLGEFFEALSDLAGNPAGIGERVNVIGKAIALGENLRQTRTHLTISQHNLDADLQGVVSRLNVLAGEIAELNAQIGFTETSSVQANDFRDQRQQRIRELVRLSGATVREEAGGRVTISLNGLPLVSGNRAASFDASTYNQEGFREIIFRGSDGLAVDATETLLSGGKIGMVLELRDVRLQNFIDHLDEFAFTLVGAINLQHALGFDLSGGSAANFFIPIPSAMGAAATVRVDPAILDDPRRLAAASSGTTAPGDNRNVLALLELREFSHPSLGNLTFQESYSALLGEVANQTESAMTKFEFRDAFLKQTQAQREAVSGVNIDEEMTKMILFQRAFEAASLLVRTADDMYSELIEMTR